MVAVDVYLGDPVTVTHGGRTYEGMGLEITGNGTVSWSPGVLHVSGVDTVRTNGHTVKIKTSGGRGFL